MDVFARKQGSGSLPVAAFVGLCFVLLLSANGAANDGVTNENLLALSAPGSHQLRVLSPDLLELTLITSKAPDPARVGPWDFVEDGGQLRLPKASDFMVRAGGATIPVQSVG